MAISREKQPSTGKSVLREAYSLALKDDRLRHALSFKGLLFGESDNARKGFQGSSVVSPGKGNREILNTALSRLRTPKNGDGRTVKMTQKVFELLQACCEGKAEGLCLYSREQKNRPRLF